MNGNLGASSPSSPRQSKMSEARNANQPPSPSDLFIYLGVGGAHWSFCLFPLEISGKNLTGSDTHTHFSPSFLWYSGCKIFELGDLFALYGYICADFIVLTECIFFLRSTTVLLCASLGHTSPVLFSAKITPHFTVS